MAIRLGILAEVVASLLVGVALLLGLARRTCRASAARQASRWSGGSRGSGGASLLAGLAVGGWVLMGFDACVASQRRGATPCATFRARSDLRC